MFDDKTCLEDGKPCGYITISDDDGPEDIKDCRNGKYQPFLLPEGYVDLVMKDLRN